VVVDVLIQSHAAEDQAAGAADKKESYKDYSAHGD
jgi:hypothetical protein